ncbi:MAG TPA: FAD-dependent oxidoreductase [Thermoleophilaceae bacterium]|nr:FAD-dependent oxidoreductase [Thermoleophilaceae bacterium]
MADPDVLIVGFGPAGAAAAIAAQDAGARVLVLEKRAAGGGNAVVSGGFLFEPPTDGAADHLEHLFFGKTPRDVAEAFADGLLGLRDWMRELGADAIPFAPPGELGSFPHLVPSWPYVDGGRDASYWFVDHAPELKRGPALWDLLERNVNERGIEVRFDAALDSLDDADSKTVVLACGGFEANDYMKDAYLPLPPTGRVGHEGNTGDAIRLASEAGAGLWHMSECFGWFGFNAPGHEAAFAIDFHGPSFLLVDADGRRFCDETGYDVHERLRALVNVKPLLAGHPRLPIYGICDEQALRAGPLNGVVGTPNDYSWSADNQRELEAGWIQPVAGSRFDSDVLRATIDDFNKGAETGRDELFGRRGSHMRALEGELYAIELHPAVATTSGGPRRDGRARVLRPDGSAIGGLFAAGGAGSVWGPFTQHGGGLTDALVFGRIAGREAAAL